LITKIILQDKDSRQYLGAGEAWVSDFKQARVFDHTHSAMFEGLRRRHKGKRLQIVWCFNEDLRNCFCIPIRSEPPPGLQSSSFGA
jgi:hypothetical protein